MPFIFVFAAFGCNEPDFVDGYYIECEKGMVEIPLDFYYPVDSDENTPEIIRQNIDQVNKTYAETCVAFVVQSTNETYYNNSSINELDGETLAISENSIPVWQFDEIESAEGKTYGGMAQIWEGKCDRNVAIIMFDRPALMAHELGHQMNLAHIEDDENIMNGKAMEGSMIFPYQNIVIYNAALDYKEDCL